MKREPRLPCSRELWHTWSCKGQPSSSLCHVLLSVLHIQQALILIVSQTARAFCSGVPTHSATRMDLGRSGFLDRSGPEPSQVDSRGGGGCAEMQTKSFENINRRHECSAQFPAT